MPSIYDHTQINYTKLDLIKLHEIRVYITSLAKKIVIKPHEYTNRARTGQNRGHKSDRILTNGP